MVDLLAVAVLYVTLAFLLAAGLRLYQDMRAVAAEQSVQESPEQPLSTSAASPLPPTAPLPSASA
jgi:hypothetical protein